MKKQLLTLGILGIMISFTTSVSAQEYVKQRITNENGGVSLVVFNENASLNKRSADNLFKEILKLKPSE
jgi:bacillolysin